jgi:signal transduction histidine kinase
MHSTYVRNFANTAVLVITSFIIVGVAFGVISRNVFLTETREQVVKSSRELTAMTTAYAREGEIRSPELGMTLAALGGSTGQQIFITDARGVIISCSDVEPTCVHIGARLDELLLSSLPRSGSAAYLDTLGGMYGDNHYTVVSAVTDAKGHLTAYLFVSRDTRAALSVWEAMLPMLFMVSMVVLMLALLFGFANSRALAQPLREMADAARRFGRGDLSVRVDASSEDEIGELGEAFNSMADSLEKSEQRRREFIANVSHELKTPMTTIAGYADGILDGTIPPESEKKYLQTISSETKRLSRLVRSMLELSRIQAGNREDLLSQSFDISEVLRRTLVNFIDKIEERGLDVDFQVPEEPIVVMGNADAITQVVYNLFDNAVKFSRNGTELGVSLWKDDAKAYVSVRNHGSTIPEAEIPLLFERFHKSDRSRSQDRDGVGLGLYIVKTILNNHGEDIAVTSRQGVTDFVFTLALKPESKKGDAKKQ